ncbi:MAG: hypothetical protein ABSF60_09055 [Verrucomicrobiota bacterium]
MRRYAVGVQDNFTNGQLFTSCSLSNFQLENIYDVWKGRLSGMLLSGYLFDFLVNHSTGSVDQIDNIFGLYQSLWLFFLFLVVIFALRQSLVINLGIFAGLMYIFLPASGLYFYPWDIPATLFFTLAVLLFERRRIWLMLAATCAGSFFKETVLVCALLVLFAGQWRWWRRIAAFAGILAVYVVGKKILLDHLHVMAAPLSMGDAKDWAGLLNTRIFVENLRVLFSPAGIYVIFANAGTTAAALLLCWRRHFLPYLVLILAYLAGQIMYGDFQEFRIFMQILPLGLILLSERWRNDAGAGIVDPSSAGAASRDSQERKDSDSAKHPKASMPDWAVRKMSPVFLSTATALIVLSTMVVAWRYYVVLEYRNNIGREESQLAFGRSVRDLETVCAWFENGLADAQSQPAARLTGKNGAGDWGGVCKWFAVMCAGAELKLAIALGSSGREAEAMDRYRAVLNLEARFFNNGNIGTARLVVTANNNLAWLLATASDPRLHNGSEAVRLSERACQLTGYKEAILILTLVVADTEAGRMNDAAAAAQKARAVAQANGQANVVELVDQWFKLYQPP